MSKKSIKWVIFPNFAKNCYLKECHRHRCKHFPSIMLLTHLLELKWKHVLWKFSENIFWKLGSQNCTKSGQNMTTVSPTYILGSWKPLKTLSKHFLISITPTSTNGLSMYLISTSLIILSRLCNKTSSQGPKNHQFDSWWSFNSDNFKSTRIFCFEIATPTNYMENFLLGVWFGYIWRAS